jgi:nickel-dependent lactate racemase
MSQGSGETFVRRGGAGLELFNEELDRIFSGALSQALASLTARAAPGGGVSKVLILPPDITRFPSRAGFLTGAACRELAGMGCSVVVMPALGTHTPMSGGELARMYPGVAADKFRVHNWRDDVVELGRLEADWVEQVTAGAVRYDWPVQVNRLLRDGGFDLIISIGQVVPHEVAGMANHTKNIFVGTGGKEAIDKSHFAGAVCGMEKIMGRRDNPVRAMFDEGFRRFGDQLPPVLWVLTVVDPGNRVRGLFAGFGRDCFEQAAALAGEVNVNILDEPVKKAVVYLEPEEFRSTWLGNKAVYRTRMAMADGGELIILAPGLEQFGEDRDIDALIRRHGYRPAGVIRDRVRRDRELAANLSAAAHLIHGSGEGRFTIRYCPGRGLSRGEIESAGYEWGGLDEALRRYRPGALTPGWNNLPGGERIFFIPNPALGLWAERRRFS